MFTVDLSKPEGLSFYDYFSHFEIIPLETETGASVSYFQTEWKMYHGLHYMLNTNLHTLDIFDGEGRFLRQINHRGNGHGEYGEAYDFQLNPFTGNLEILDPMRGIYVYNSTGKVFIEHFRVPILAVHYFASLSEDVYVLYSKFRKEEHKMLFYSKSKDRIVAEAYPLPYFFVRTAWLPSSNPFIRLDDKLFFCQTYDGTVFRINGDCSMEERFRWDFGKQNFPIDRLPQNEGMNWYIEYTRNEAPNYAVQFRYNAENSRYFMNHFQYDNRYYSLIYDKKSYQLHLIKSYKEQLMVLPQKMDDDALYYLMPGMFVERWSRDNGGQLKFPSADEDACYIVKYYFKKDE